MKIQHKAGIISTALLASLFTASLVVVQNRINHSIQPYVESNITRIIETQEDVLGIQHFGVPKISYKQPHWIKDGFQVSGAYEPEKDQIYLPLGLAITPERNLSNILAICMTFGSTHNVKETLDHELGHFYADKLCESLGKGDWLHFSDGREINVNDVGIKLVSEGIAEYFKRTLNGGKDDFEDSDWPRKFEDFFTRKVIYDGGFHLVKPIIDMYGRRGIERLMSNPPHTMQDLNYLPMYQNRVIASLSE